MMSSGVTGPSANIRNHASRRAAIDQQRRVTMGASAADQAHILRTRWALAQWIRKHTRGAGAKCVCVCALPRLDAKPRDAFGTSLHLVH